MDTIISFAQFQEDIVLYNSLIKYVPMSEVFYIDAGANDAIESSVTFLFYLFGGRGINIEPQSEYKNKYDTFRSKDINLFIGVGNKTAEMEMYGTGQAATFDKNGKYARGNKAIIHVDTLTNICDKYLAEGQKIHFLKIDVEGFEKECIEGLNFTKYRPWIICVESFEPGEDIPSFGKWEKILVDNNYRYAYTRGVNRFYCAGEKEELFHTLSNSEEIDNKYKIMKMGDYEAMNNMYLNSLSYKITAPLRQIKSVFGKLGLLKE